MSLLFYSPGILGRAVCADLEIRLVMMVMMMMEPAEPYPVPTFASGTVLGSFHLLILSLLRTTLWDGLGPFANEFRHLRCSL